MTVEWLAIGLGAIVGIALGLTGGGGAILAVPLLIYGLGFSIGDAASVSLIAVGAAALLGGILALPQKNVSLPVILTLGVTGMVTAPVGVILRKQLPEQLIILCFAVLMVIVGIRMWRRKVSANLLPATVCRPDSSSTKIKWSCRCSMVLLMAGAVVGILSGVFGVGGGFLIVPALVFVAGLSARASVANSLWIIAAVAISGSTFHFASAGGIASEKGWWFLAGSCLGVGLGTLLVRRLPDQKVNRGFAVSAWAMAVLMVFSQG